MWPAHDPQDGAPAVACWKSHLAALAPQPRAAPTGIRCIRCPETAQGAGLEQIAGAVVHERRLARQAGAGEPHAHAQGGSPDQRGRGDGGRRRHEPSPARVRVQQREHTEPTEQAGRAEHIRGPMLTACHAGGGDHGRGDADCAPEAGGVPARKQAHQRESRQHRVADVAAREAVADVAEELRARTGTVDDELQRLDGERAGRNREDEVGDPAGSEHAPAGEQHHDEDPGPGGPRPVAHHLREHLRPARPP
jgi:hypothetical protein